MKRLFCLILTGIVLISLTACQTNTDNSNNSENNVNYVTTSCTKDFVDEFMSIIGDVELGGLSIGMTLDKEHCFNVTPLSVASQTDIKIFKFSDSCVSLALIDGKVYSICDSFGGFGFVNAVPWDYDEDGNLVSYLKHITKICGRIVCNLLFSKNAGNFYAEVKLDLVVADSANYTVNCISCM